MSPGLSPGRKTLLSELTASMVTTNRPKGTRTAFQIRHGPARPGQLYQHCAAIGGPDEFTLAKARAGP